MTPFHINNPSEGDDLPWTRSTFWFSQANIPDLPVSEPTIEESLERIFVTLDNICLSLARLAVGLEQQVWRNSKFGPSIGPGDSKFIGCDDNQRKPVDRLDDSKKSRKSWCHTVDDPRPPDYTYGPLRGNQQQLASWISHDGKQDRRRLQRPAQSGRLWIVRLTSREYEVWFRSQTEYAAANQKKLASEQASKEQ